MSEQTNNNENKNNEDLSFLECVKIILITLAGILIPSGAIGYVIHLITKLNLIASIVIGIIAVLLIAYALGFHKPATLNEYNEENDEDDDD